MMTKQEALGYFDNKEIELAKALGISKQAVNQWPDDEPIPELREYQIRDKIQEPEIKQSA